MLVSGNNVIAYVPKGYWKLEDVDPPFDSGDTGVSVVNIEGNSITPQVIPTGDDFVNSCASNPLTGITVCTANSAHVYLLKSTTLVDDTLMSNGSGEIRFSGGVCTNCGVAMDAIHNKAVIALSMPGEGGLTFQDFSSWTSIRFRSDRR